ncbi:TPA: LPXTG cell wall anchor domain-containing protein, partial [Staphylococcus aureus]|nr:LPXTG cell wall anchor domain-containing protein [Staphylococcus aureus]HDR2187946.1 LPXTG cell wall anchor domain-containing protein [Staphylococcus aureus]
ESDSDSDSDSRVTPPNNEQKAPSNPKGEVNHANKVSKQHKTDALPETGDKSENTNATLFGAMMALLGSLLLFRKRKQDHK